MERILITGANRGIGLALVRQLLATESIRLFATARRPEAATDLQQLAASHADCLTVLPLDVTDQTSVGALATTVARQVNGLDVLINNAGFKPPATAESFANITSETLLNTLAINVAGPLLVVKALVDLLAAGRNSRIVNISSQMGSMTWGGGGFYAYTTSKAALNMVTRRLAVDLQSRGITTITMHPGWVRTDMGGPSASLSPDESASGIIKVVSNLTPRQNGQFIQWNGEIHAW